jgi:hypothetical protein
MNMPEPANVNISYSQKYTAWLIKHSSSLRRSLNHEEKKVFVRFVPGRCRGRTGRSCSSAGPGRPDTSSESRKKFYGETGTT